MRTQKLSISILLLTVLLGLSTACSKHPSDDTIVKDIQDKIAADPDTKDSQPVVTAKDAKVTLSGQVTTPAARQKIEQIAQAEPGVVGLDDLTSVQPDASAAAASPAPTQTMAPAAAPMEKPKPQPIVIPAGTTLTVTVSQALSSKTSQTGQTFLATVAQPISVGGRKAIPAGATVSGTVVTAKSQGKIKGQGELDLALTSVSLKGRSYDIQTAVVEQTVKGKGKRTAVATGGGAAGGALIGGLAGGGKGAGIGALVGAGAGLLGGSLTGNQQIEIPAESALSFRLSAPLTLPPSE